MYTLIVQNKYGQQLELTHNDAYVISSIEGLDPPDAVINTTRNTNTDGSVFNSSYVDNRQIIITLAINSPAEGNRIELYKYFKNKYPVRIYYKNGHRDVYIDGYCKNMQIEFFNIKQIAQITIICPEPFFKSVNEEVSEFSVTQSVFEFPFSVEDPPAEIEFSRIEYDSEKDVTNSGDVETGMIIRLRAKGSVNYPGVVNTETGEFFKLNLPMNIGDEIYINTKVGEKTVTYTHDSVTSTIVNSIVSGSTWLTLRPGSNLFMTTATSGLTNLEAYCTLTDQYEGV